MAEKFWIQLAHDIDHPSLPFFLAKSGEIMKTYTLGHSQDLKPSQCYRIYPYAASCAISSICPLNTIHPVEYVVHSYKLRLENHS